MSKSFILIKSQEEKDQETKCCRKGDVLLKRKGKTAEECGNNVMVLIFNVFRVCNVCWSARMSLLLHMHTSRPPKTLQTKTCYCHLAVIFYYYKIQCFSLVLDLKNKIRRDSELKYWSNPVQVYTKVCLLYQNIS